MNDIIDNKNENNNMDFNLEIEKIKEEYEKKKNELESKLNDNNNQMNLIKEKYENELKNKENEIKLITEKFKSELNEKDKEIDLLNEKLENEKNNNELKLENEKYKKELNEKEDEIKMIKRKLENEYKLISNFFTFYNQKIDLINDLNFLDYIANRLEFSLFNDDLNEQYSIQIIDTFNNFISKIMLDNKEMYEIISETKTMLNEKDQNLKKFMMEISQLNEIKNENNYLKQQVNDLINQINLTRNYY